MATEQSADHVTVTVKVTQDDIDKGERETCRRCPIALALNRLLALPAEVRLGNVRSSANIVTSYHPKYWPTLPLPAECKRFIKIFDGRGPVTPFDFPLTIDKRYLRQPGGASQPETRA